MHVEAGRAVPAAPNSLKSFFGAGPGAGPFSDSERRKVFSHRNSVVREGSLYVHILDDVHAASAQSRREEQLEALDLVPGPVIGIVDDDVGLLIVI